MRASIVAWVSLAALVASVATVSGQVKENEREKSATGQSERPKDPKHVEPESSSHNADSPTKSRGTPEPKPGAEKPSTTQPKKNPG